MVISDIVCDINHIYQTHFWLEIVFENPAFTEYVREERTDVPINILVAHVIAIH